MPSSHASRSTHIVRCQKQFDSMRLDITVIVETLGPTDALEVAAPVRAFLSRVSVTEIALRGDDPDLDLAIQGLISAYAQHHRADLSATLGAAATPPAARAPASDETT